MTTHTIFQNYLEQTFSSLFTHTPFLKVFYSIPQSNLQFSLFTHIKSSLLHTSLFYSQLQTIIFTILRSQLSIFNFFYISYINKNTLSCINSLLLCFFTSLFLSPLSNTPTPYSPSIPPPPSLYHSDFLFFPTSLHLLNPSPSSNPIFHLLKPPTKPIICFLFPLSHISLMFPSCLLLLKINHVLYLSPPKTPV